MVRHDLVKAFLEFRKRSGQCFLRRSLDTMARPRHAVLPFILIGRHAHALLIARVECILNEGYVLCTFCLNLGKTRRLIIDLSLEPLDESIEIADLIALRRDKHFELLPLDVNVSTLLFCSLLESTTLLQHIDELFEVSWCQFLGSIILPGA